VAFFYKSLVLVIRFDALETVEKSFDGRNCSGSSAAGNPERFLLKGGVIPFPCLWRRLEKSIRPLWIAEYPPGSSLF